MKTSKRTKPSGSSRQIGRKAAARPRAVTIPASRQRGGSAAGAIDPARILVRDVMRTDVLVLRADDPIKSAAEQMEETRASGAPVVDAANRLVGVLTLSDIARSEHVTEDGVTTRSEPRATETLADMVDAADDDEELFPTEDYEEGVLGGLRVADWMTRGVIKVTPEATLASACRRMLDEAIHRVFVADKGRLVGVLSTKDVVRLLAESTTGKAGRKPRR